MCSAHCAPTAPTSPNPDRMIYFVLCSYDGALAWAERDVGDTDKATTIHDIRSGELRNVVQVIELNYTEFSSRDVTGEMVVEARADEIRSKLLSQLAEQDHARDHLKHEVA